MKRTTHEGDAEQERRAHDDSGEFNTLGAKHNDPAEVGPCHIEARISVGPSSLVYRAVDTELSRTVVVKILASPHDEDVGVVQRFQFSSQALLGVSAPHLASIVRTGMFGQAPYAVYEYLEGEDLERSAQRERAMLPSAALRAVLDAADGLSAAAARGVVHGDLRPRHLIRTRGVTRVTGLGLSPPRRTAHGRVLPGHAAYLAPELVEGQAPDVQSDIYALGCTLFELLTGRSPFGAVGADAVLACHVHEPFPSVRSVDPRIPEELDELLARMTAKARARRLTDYVDLLQSGAAVLPALRRQRAEDPALIVEEGRQEGLRVAIPDGDLLLGRVPGEGVQIDDGRCSRRHAMLRRAGDYIELEDLGSRNGVRVNGVEVRSRQVFPGDRIEIGDTVLRVEGPTRALQQLPALLDIPASPLRGAFGDLEISRPRAQQLNAEGLADATGAGGALRLRALSLLAPLLARRHERAHEIQLEFLAIVGDTLAADERALVRVEAGQPVFEAKNSHEAQVLSCVLPALERALPGQLSLATSVRVGSDERWAVLLAPLLRGNETIAYAVLAKTAGHFDEAALGVLEGSCALLSLRATATPA